MTDFAILTNALVKNYGPVQALRGVDLQVHQGEIFGFLGPNGAGKTTTIRCLLDLIRPNGGMARVLGFDPQKESHMVRSLTGYLPGELRLEDGLTVESTLRYLNALRGNSADWGYILILAQRLDLDLKIQVRNLSKGNRQKVGVIQALMHRPRLFLLDEPTSGLDPLAQQEVLSLIVEANRDGATVFFSSHIISEVEHIATRVAIIRQGLVVEVAETGTLKKRALRRVKVRFKQPVDHHELDQIEGIRLISQDGLMLNLEIEGEMDGLIKALGKYPVSEFETERLSLEEVFLTYYVDGRLP